MSLDNRIIPPGSLWLPPGATNQFTYAAGTPANNGYLTVLNYVIPDGKKLYVRQIEWTCMSPANYCQPYISFNGVRYNGYLRFGQPEFREFLPPLEFIGDGSSSFDYRIYNRVGAAANFTGTIQAWQE